MLHLFSAVSAGMGAASLKHTGVAAAGVPRSRAAAARLPCLTCPRYELGRQPAMTKLSSNVCVRRVRVRGGNSKFRALRLDHGNFSWGSEVRAGGRGPKRRAYQRRRAPLAKAGAPYRQGRSGPTAATTAADCQVAHRPAAREPGLVAQTLLSPHGPPLAPASAPAQATTRKVRILDVSYNASNNELVSARGAGVLACRSPTLRLTPGYWAAAVGSKTAAPPR